MTNPVRVTRARTGATALVLAALVAGGMAVPLASPASATTPEFPTAPLIQTGTPWKYLDNNTDPSPGVETRNDWTKPEFNDAQWKQAVSGFGAKSGELGPSKPYMPATLLNHYIDPSAATKTTIPTYFFRTKFTLDSGVAALVGKAQATISFDDAARIYVNGTRVANFIDERVDDTLPSNLQYAGAGNGNPLTQDFTVDPALLHDGENTIAVALYQDRASSSDVFFDLSNLSLTKAIEPGESGTVVAAPTRIILTPTETPSTSQAFSWTAGDESHAAGQVEIGRADAAETRTVDGYAVGKVNANANEHFSAVVGELVPATTYRYRVGLPGSWSDWFEFTTENPSARDFQFIYYGDAQIGLDTTWPGVVQKAEQRAPRSVGSVHAGDLIDTSSDDTQWRNWFRGMERSAASTNVMAAPGNHEYRGDALMTSWKAHFEYPLNQPTTSTVGELAKLAVGDTDVARQYAAYFAHWSNFAAETVYFTDYQGVRFITLNATRDTTFLKPPTLPACTTDDCPSTRVADLWTEYQAAWLEHVLTTSPSKWNVVTFHQPVYSTSSGRDEKVLRDHWVPVFERNNIDLVLMGHDHTYARGYKNSSLTETPGLTVGPVYAVSNSGAKHYKLESEDANVWTNNGATQVIRGEKVTTYQVIDVSENQLVYRSYLAEAGSGAFSMKLSDTTGTRPVYAPQALPAIDGVYDEFTVTKYNTGEKWVTEAGMLAPAAPAIALSATTAKQGEKLVLAGTGFAPGAQLKVELHSDPVELGTFTADAQGGLTASITIPVTTQTSTPHEVVVILPNGKTISTPLEVTAANTDGEPGGDQGSNEQGGNGSTKPAATGKQELSATGGSADLLALGIAGGMVVLAGAALIVMRTRRHSTSTSTSTSTNNMSGNSGTA